MSWAQPSVEESCAPLQLAQKQHHLTSVLDTDHSQRRPRHLCKPTATTKALRGNQQSKHSQQQTLYLLKQSQQNFGWCLNTGSTSICMKSPRQGGTKRAWPSNTNTNHSTYAFVVTTADHLQAKQVLNPFVLDTQSRQKHRISNNVTPTNSNDDATKAFIQFCNAKTYRCSG